VPILVFGLTLAVTGLVTLLASRYIRTRDEFRLENEIHRVEIALRQRTDAQIALLQNTAAMFNTQRDVTPEEFRAYVRNIGLTGRYNGTLALAYAARVLPANRAAIEREVRANGFPNFRIHPPSQKEAWAILMIEPRSPANLLAHGYDMAENPVRQNAMAQARDSGGVTMTGRVTLKQDADRVNDPGFLMYCPLYRGGGVPPTEAARRAAFMGFVYSPFRAKEFFGEVFPSRSLQLWVEIYDETNLAPENLLYRNVPSGTPPPPPSLLRPVIVSGRTWMVRYYPQPDFLATSGEPLVRLIPVGGLIVALLLAGLSFSQVKANDALVAQTEELHQREFHQRLLARAGEALSATEDVDRNLQAVARLAVPDFADWCAVDVRESEGNVRRVAVIHVNPAKATLAQELQEKYPPTPDGLDSVSEVLRTGHAVLRAKVTPEMIRHASKDTEHARLAEEVGFSSAMIVPMKIHEETIGVIVFGWSESGFHYNEEDFRLAQEIGVRAAVAVENARLFEAREREISVRRAAEAQVRDLNENLERLVAERTRELMASNQELEAFCYSVSHDLRAPLRSVDGFSKAILEDYGDRLDAEGRGFVDRVRMAARRMDELITALLALSRLTRAELHLQRTDLSELARLAAEDARRGEGVPAEIVIQPDMVGEADPRMMRILFDNLIGNALKFSAPNPNPRVEVGNRDGAFFVRDNGVGFNPAYANKLFAPFERLHSNGEFPGTGIGLATVQRIVARHGGRVWAEGEEGKGATFFFTLEG
jgi:signal transduction histidine kinase/CHASE1-domain containing sensor protein